MTESSSHSLVFSAEIQSDDRYKLFEIPLELLSTIEEIYNQNSQSPPDSKKICFKGLDKDEAVLCTKDKTYALKNAHTSNCLLITRVEQISARENSKFEVIHNLNSVVEVSRTVPRLNRVKELLGLTTYIDPALEYQLQGQTFYSFVALKEVVQASDEEIKETLEKLKILTLEGRLWLIDLKYFCEVLSLILVTSFVNSFPLDALNLNQILNSLKDHPVPPPIIAHCLYSVSELKDGVCCLNELEVIRVFGEFILKETQNRPILVDDFIKQLRERLPETFDPKLFDLEGLFYLDTYPNNEFVPNRVHYLSSMDLPFDAKLRFKELFSRKTRWSNEEIQPFLKEIALSNSQKEMDLLILKFCKVLKVDEKQVLISKLKL